METAGPTTSFQEMVPSGNTDYTTTIINIIVVIIFIVVFFIILRGIKDLSQPVSVALQNTKTLSRLLFRS